MPTPTLWFVCSTVSSRMRLLPTAWRTTYRLYAYTPQHIPHMPFPIPFTFYLCTHTPLHTHIHYLCLHTLHIYLPCTPFAHTFVQDTTRFPFVVLPLLPFPTQPFATLCPPPRLCGAGTARAHTHTLPCWFCRFLPGHTAAPRLPRTCLRTFTPPYHLHCCRCLFSRLPAYARCQRAYLLPFLLPALPVRPHIYTHTHYTVTHI